MSISLTSEAAEHVSRQLASRGKGEGIRIGVKTSGCSGLAYVLEFVDQALSTVMDAPAHRFQPGVVRFRQLQ